MSVSDSRTLKIGYVVKMFPRLSETFILNEIIELERQGAEVTVFSIKKPNEGRFHPQLSQLKAKVHYLEDLDTRKFPVWLSLDWGILGESVDRIWPILKESLAEGDASRVEQIWWAVWMAARIKESDIDRLHAHFASLPSTVADLAGRIANVPYSFTAHAKDIYVYSQNEHRLSEKLNTSELVVTVTDYNRQYLTSQGASVDKIELIYNGINLDRFRFVPIEARDERFIIAIGRLVPKKGFDDLLRACAILKKNGEEFTCRIVGDGPERTSLRSMISEMALEDSVELTGPLNSEEVRALMGQATILALPCKAAEDGNIDALPTVLLEALAVGLPSVSTAFSGIPEIIDHDQEGLLVEAGDYEALASEISRLLKDRTTRQKMGLAGRVKAEQRFDITRNVRKLLHTFLRDGKSANMNAALSEVERQKVHDE